MKKIILVILFAVVILTMASCNNINTDGNFWDGNYIYYNGYKTKTNSTDKIYYLTEFSYNSTIVRIESFIFTKYYFNALHLIVKDESGINYYLRYDAENNTVLSVYSIESDIEYGGINNFLYFKNGNNIIYVCDSGVFPVINSTQNLHHSIKDGYLIVNNQGLKYAKYNSESFTKVTDYYVEKYAVNKEKIYYMLYDNTFNIYDIKTNENHSFEAESGQIIFFENGTYLVGQYNEIIYEDILFTMQSYNINSVYNNFKLIAYDDDYNKIVKDLPKDYDFSYRYLYKDGIINLIGYEYKADGIVTCHPYYFNENHELEKGSYNFPVVDNPQTEIMYSANKCGVYSYTRFDKYNNNFIAERREISFYGTNTETNEKYLCFNMILDNKNEKFPIIIVILPY